MGKLSRETIDEGLKVLINQEDSKLITHLNSCVHCGLCAKSCIYYMTDPDPRYIPATKVDAVASVYKRYCTFTGKIFPKLLGARELTDDSIAEMVDLLYGACSMCGRCVKHCSIGVDITYVTRKGREMLSNMGYVPESLNATVNAAMETGNNMGISDVDYIETLEWLEEDLQFEMDSQEARIPINESDKDILYTLNPREPKFFPLSITAMAAIFYAAKESWTLSSKMYDITNYAFFSGNMEEARIIAERLYDEVENMNAKTCVLAECGHGSRAFRWEGPNYMKKSYPFKTMTSVELIADYIREGRIRVDSEKITNIVTMHDPCNLARGGGIWKEQRYIMSQICKNFVEMEPHGIDNLCCGGGGGQLAMSEYNSRRMSIAGRKADQIKKTKATIVVTPCHNCVDQLIQTNAEYKLNVQIKTIAEIVADTLIFEKDEN